MERKDQSKNIQKYEIIAIILVFLGLIVIQINNYLLFHSFVEIFRIIIACSIFVMVWNSREFVKNNFLMFLGITYLFVGIVDLLHTLAYKGVNVFDAGGANLATQLWILARYIEGISLFIAPIFFTKKINSYIVFLIYFVATSWLLSTIFYIKIFPDCFVEGTGLTSFKIISEYIISIFLIGAIALMYSNRRHLNSRVFKFFIISIVMAIASEFTFTLYIDVYGITNFIGHFFKVGSFYLIYKSIIQIGYREPYELLFRNLSEYNQKVILQKGMLEDANKTKDKIFSIIAHDLRSPFNAVLATSEMLSDEWESIQREEMKELMDIIHASIENMNSLLTNLLHWSRSQIGIIEYNPIENNLKYIVSSELALLYSCTVEKEIEIFVNINENMVGYYDENMIATVIRNLLSNAIKFSDSGSNVTISAEDKDPFIEVSIIDNGIGITEEDLNNLFRIDYRFSKKGTAGEKGTGLGLILCKEFVEKNGGVIWVERNQEKGSTFKFTLPKRKSTS